MGCCCKRKTVLIEFSAEIIQRLASKELQCHYTFFGLHFRSNLEIPGAKPSSQFLPQPDVEVYFGIAPYSTKEDLSRTEELTYVSADRNAAGEPALRIWKVARGAFVRLAYEDGTQFWLDGKLETVWVTWPDSLSLENSTSYLLGPVLGVVLRMRGVTCLHASAVSIGDRGVAFVGSAGTGKSTTAAAFARQGYGVISDDIVALVEREGAFLLMPAYPHLCLWPESVKILYGTPEALPRFTLDWDKRRLDLGELGTRFESRSLALGAIYLLGDRRPDPAPYVETIQLQSALLSLVADTYANKILDRDMRAKEFDVLGQLVSRVPVRRVYPNRDAARIADLCRVVQKDYESLSFPTSASS